MPLLFISYKREKDQKNLEQLIQKLDEALYAVWYDREQIRIGDPSWRAKIRDGITRSNGLVLCLTPLAHESEVMLEEVTFAIEKKKPIFPVVLKGLDDPSAILRHFGLSDEMHVEFLRNEGEFEGSMPRLLNGLLEKGLKVSPYDMRQKNTKSRTLYQDYLRDVASRYGRLSLKDVNPEYAGARNEIDIERLFTPLNTDFSLKLDIVDYLVRRWWVTRQPVGTATFAKGQQVRDAEARRLDKEKQAYAQEVGWDWSALEKIVEQSQRTLEERREEERLSRFSRSDDGVELVPLRAFDMAATCRRLIVMGEAGSGKTAFARFLMTALAAQQVQGWDRELLKRDERFFWTHRGITPVMVSARELFTMAGFKPEAEFLLECLRKQYVGTRLEGIVEEIREDFTTYGAVLVIDGLDIVLGGARRDVTDMRARISTFLSSVSDYFKGTRVILTARTQAFEDWHLEGYTTIALQTMDDDTRTRLVENLYRTTTPEKYEENTAQLLTALQDYSDELSRNPRFVTLLATLYPQKRGVLFDKTIQLQIDKWASEPTLTTANLRSLLRMESDEEAKKYMLSQLARLAYDATEKHVTQHPDEPIPLSVLRDVTGDIADDIGVSSEEVQKYLSQSAYLIVPVKEGGKQTGFKFAHNSFREYLAAHWLHEDITRKAQSFRKARELVEKHPSVWLDTLRWLGDVINNDGKQITNPYLWQLLDDLIEDDVPKVADERHTPQFYAAWLAAQIIYDQAIHEEFLQPNSTRLSKRDRQLYKDVLDWLALLLNTKDALDVSIRAECGTLLGRIGVWREGVGRKKDEGGEKGLPDIVWCQIPEGEFLIGSNPEKDRFAMPNELPQRVHYLPTFCISKYPVTYEQYEAFVEDGGYRERDYWTESGWAWREGRNHPAPNVWNVPQWHIGNHPVVGITWYEAYAFCRWLSLKTGLNVRLPSEWEWEKATRGTDGLIYPYGDTFLANAANTRRTGLARPSSVGIFVGYESPYGLADASGNVYEWCSTAYDVADFGREANTLNLEDPEPSIGGYRVKRVLRGGCWQSYGGFARAAYRFGEYPHFTTNYWGFRLAYGDA